MLGDAARPTRSPRPGCHCPRRACSPAVLPILGRRTRHMNRSARQPSSPSLRPRYQHPVRQSTTAIAAALAHRRSYRTSNPYHPLCASSCPRAAAPQAAFIRCTHQQILYQPPRPASLNARESRKNHENRSDCTSPGMIRRGPRFGGFVQHFLYQCNSL